MSSKLLVASATLVAAVSAQAAVSVSSAAFTYSQSFDSLSAGGATNAWLNDSTLTGWSLFNKNNAAITAYSTGNGSSNAGGFFSFGSAGSGERALGATGSSGTVFGSPASGAVAGYFALALTNNSGAELTSFTLRYDGEQWRDGGVSIGLVGSVAQTMKLEYGFGASFTSVAWSSLPAAFEFTSPVVGAVAGTQVDGNAAGKVAGIGGSVSTSWANGQTLWIRWIEVNDPNNDHALAIDNVSLSVTAAVPEPGTYAMLLAGLGAVGFIARRRRG